MLSRTAQSLRTELSHVRTQAEEMQRRLQRLQCLVDTQVSEYLAVLEQNQELRMIADHAADGAAVQDRLTARHDDAA